MSSKYLVSTGLLLLAFGTAISACADSSSANCNKRALLHKGLKNRATLIELKFK